MGWLHALIGELHWTPPGWARRLRQAVGGRALVAVFLVAAAALATFVYFSSRPQPSAIVAEATAPGVTPVIDEELKPQPLAIDFRVRPGETGPAEISDSVARVDMIGTEIETGIRLSPDHAGVWRWDSENRLLFTPADDWPAGTHYTVEFDETIFAPEVRLASSETEFETAPFTVEISEVRFYQDPRDDQKREVVATLAFSHPVSPESLENSLALDMRPDESTVADDATRLEFTIDYDKHHRFAYVHSAPIALPQVESFATLRLDPGLKPAAGRSARKEPLFGNVGIPDVSSYFRVESAKALIVRDDNDDPGQTVTLGFTDRVASQAFRERLKIWLLPEYHVINGRRLKSWKTPREVTDSELARATPLEAVHNPTELDAAALQSFRIDTVPGRYVYLRIEPGLSSTGGFEMGEGYDTVLKVPGYPREVKIARDGAVLPVSGDHKLTFIARGVPALRVEVGRVLDKQINHLATQTRGDIASPYFNNYNFNESNITERVTRYITLHSAHPKEAVFSSLDLSEFLSRGGFYFIEVQGWEPDREQVLGIPDRRFVMISDLGLVVKGNADQSQDVFVHGVAAGRPVAGARVELLGRNGVQVRSGLTDARGHVHLASVKGLDREKQPAVFLVSNGPDRMFLPFERRTRQLHLERFDIGGAQVSEAADRLKAYLFTDRGLYRPGDTANIAAAVKREDFTPLPDVPIELVANDARGATVYRQRLNLPETGFFDWQVATEATSATGNYTASVYLVRTPNQPRRMLGSVTFKVEEFQPDRMRIRAEIAGDRPAGWIKPGALETRVTLENLFGTPATGRRVTGRWQLTPISMQLPQFEGFVFGDPFRAQGIESKTVSGSLAEATTDESGVATLPLALAQYDQGIYRLSVFVEGFEAGGGRSVRAQADTVLSPLDFLVGYKSDGDLGFIKRGVIREVRFMAVNSDAEPVALDSARLHVVEQRFVSTLVQQPDGTYAYQSVQKEIPLSDEAFPIAADGAQYALPTASPGRFVVKVYSDTGLLMNKVAFVVAGARNIAGNLERNAELDLKLNGRDFAPGEEIEFEITAPYAGTGLVTIERDKVYTFKWFRAEGTSSVQRISVPDGLEGNGYLNVAFVRDIDSPEIFVSPLSYAVAPFSINRAARDIEITLDVPNKARPGRELTIGYRASRPSKIVVYGVDEGILQVARYVNPDPLAFFLSKKALQVSTFQVVDLILPAFELLRAVAAGGGEGAALLGRNLNPFRRKTDAPVVFWSGILDAGPEAGVYKYPVPDYFDGRLRVMAVAVSDAALGASAKSTIVRGPLVLTPNVLTAAAPGDEFEVSVGIANNLEGSGADARIRLRLEPSAHLEAIGELTWQLTIGEGSEGRARFRIRALERLGPAELRFVGSVGGEEVSRKATLSIRPAVPFMTTVRTGHASAAPLRVSLPRRMHPEFAEQSAAASASPLILAEGLTHYLSQFPHQCVEQMVSRVFGQLGLMAVPDYGPDEARFRDMFDTLIRALRRRQHTDGGFRFWVTSAESALLPSIYAMHFLTDAKEFGLAVPADIDRNGLEYLRKIAANQANDLPGARNRAYAVYVLTRNAKVTTNYLTNLHEYLERAHKDAWRADLTGTYMAASYQLLRQSDLGENLIGGYRFGAGQSFDSDFDTRLGRDAQYLYLTARHFPARLSRIGPDAIEALVDPIFENRFNTLSSAYTVLALGAYTQSAQRSGQLPLLAINGIAPDDRRVGLTDVARRFARATVPPGMSAVEITGAGGNPIYHSTSQAGFDIELPAAATREGLEIFREYLGRDGRPVESARIGDELTVRMRVRSLGRYRSNVAIVDLLPGGFEVLTDSIRDNYDGWSMDYKDVREDRVVIYGGFDDGVTEYQYKVKVTSAGEFVVPSAYAGSMYDRSVHARTKPARFSVQDAE